jgi:hypothetical protein
MNDPFWTLPGRAYLENNQSLVVLRIVASAIITNAFENLLNQHTSARFCMGCDRLQETFGAVLAAA